MRWLKLSLGLALSSAWGLIATPASAQFSSQLTAPPCAYIDCTVNSLNIVGPTAPANGLYMPSAGIIALKTTNGTWEQNGDWFYSSSASGPDLNGAGATGTTPTFRPNRSASNAGIAALAAGNVTIDASNGTGGSAVDVADFLYNQINFNQSLVESGSITGVTFYQLSTGSNGVWNASGISFPNTGAVMFSSTSNAAGTIDTGLSRSAAGVVSVDTGTRGNAAGELKLSFGTATATAVCENAGLLSLCTSLRQYKDHITNARPGIINAMTLSPKQYWSKTNNEWEYGLIADEVQKWDGDMAHEYGKDTARLASYDKGKLIGVDYMHLAALDLKFIQEQQRELEWMWLVVAGLILWNVYLTFGRVK